MLLLLVPAAVPGRAVSLDGLRKTGYEGVWLTFTVAGRGTAECEFVPKPAVTPVDVGSQQQPAERLGVLEAPRVDVWPS